MASKIVILVAIQALVFQMTLAQVCNRYVNNVVNEALLPQVVPQVLPQILPQVLPYQTVPNIVEYPQVYNYPQVPTTVVQDSSVSNNLANALQLLVVSNLLSTALPFGEEVIVPTAYPQIVEQVVSPCANSYYAPQLVSSVPSCGCGYNGLFY